jgi:hypothetical protein
VAAVAGDRRPCADLAANPRKCHHPRIKNDKPASPRRCAQNPLTSIPKNGDIEGVKIFGEAVIAGFAKKHPASRKPLHRFVTIARAALWPHFPAVNETFPATDYAPATGTLIFNIGGN